jgi:hypothetical protein
VDVRHEQSELFAPLHQVGGCRPVVREVDVHRVSRDRIIAPEVVQAAVASDPVQPGAQVNGTRVGNDCLERGREHLLENILGVLGAAEEVATEGKSVPS